MCLHFSSQLPCSPALGIKRGCLGALAEELQRVVTGQSTVLPALAAETRYPVPRQRSGGRHQPSVGASLQTEADLRCQRRSVWH